MNQSMAVSLKLTRFHFSLECSESRLPMFDHWVSPLSDTCVLDRLAQKNQQQKVSKQCQACFFYTEVTLNLSGFAFHLNLCFQASSSLCIRVIASVGNHFCQIKGLENVPDPPLLRFTILLCNPCIGHLCAFFFGLKLSGSMKGFPKMGMWAIQNNWTRAHRDIYISFWNINTDNYVLILDHWFSWKLLSSDW